MEQTLGSAIKAARKLRGKTQKQVSDSLGVSRPSFTLWENDVNNPSVDNLRKLCDYLAVDAEALLAGTVKEVDRKLAASSGTVPSRATVGAEGGVDETLAAIRAAAEADIGFMPTTEQALRWLVKKAGIHAVVFASP